MRLATRMERIGTETAFEAPARARALEATGREVIHLEIGEPDFDTPRNVSEAASRALLDDGATHYTAATGIAPLREAIAADVARWKGISATPDQVVVTPGAKPIMFFTMLALVNEGDEVIYPNPGFPIYESMARYVGGTPVAAPLREANDFGMDVQEVASLITDRTRLLVINSPHNPTGSILTETDIRRLAELAVEHDLVVLADEIYGRLQYSGSPLSIATLPGMAERTVTVFSFSKSYGQAGLRVGYAVGSTGAMLALRKMSHHTVYCVPRAMQLAALLALQTGADFLAEARTLYQSVRDHVHERLSELCLRPEGSTYLFLDLSRFRRPGEEDALGVLDRIADAGVLLAPGPAFGHDYASWARLCFTSVERPALDEALDRILHVLRS